MSGVVTRYVGPIPGVSDSVTHPGRRRLIKPLAFSRRLSVGTVERLTLAASVAMEQGNATLQVFLDDLARAGVVDLDDPRTLGGIAFLRQAGLISVDEAVALVVDGTPAEAA